MLVGDGLVQLNAVASFIWSQIEEVPDRSTLFRRLRRRYRGVEDRRLRLDLDSLVDGWLREGWCEEQDDPVFPFAEEPWPI